MTRKRSHKGEYSAETLKRAEQRRQDILDFLHANPGSPFENIARALPQYVFESIRGAVAGLLHWREIAASGKKREHVYFAIAETTHTSDQVRAIKVERTRNSKNRREKLYNAVRDQKLEAKRMAEKQAYENLCKAHSNIAPGHYRHDPDRMDFHNHGGQGALRRTVFARIGDNYDGI